MDNYKLKFENGRTCTIDCDSTQSFQDKINDAEKRFNSECCEINGKPIKKHSLGGFLVGATIGAILGNSVPEKTISKTATGVKRTAKSVTRKVKKQVKKFSGGGTTDDERYCRLAEDTGKGVNEGFVVGMGETIYESEDNLVKHLRSLDYEDADGNSSKKIKSKDDLLEFFYNDEYYYWTEWDCDDEIEEQGYYYTRDGKEIEIASKGKKIDPTKAPRWWNKQVREYEFFVFNTETNKVWAGNEYQNDAKDELKEFLTDAPTLPLKVLTKRAITNKKINPLAYENWARGSEVIETIQQTFRKPEQMARGSKISGKQKYVLLFITNDDHSIAEWFEIPESKFTSELEDLIFSKDYGFSEYYESDGEYKFNRIDESEKLKKFLSTEKMARGSKIKPKNNTQAVKGLVKDLENTPYSIGLAIMRERLLTYSENDLLSLEENPEAWKNPIISLGMYKDYYSRVAKELSFEPRKDNVKAVKGFVKDLENTPHGIGLAILRERLLSYAENDLKAMDKNPDAWSNPFISLGMYQDYANRVIENLKFDYATGGELGTMALAGASPQLAIASEVSRIAPATTSALDRRIASQIDPDRPKWYEDRGNQYGKGGILDDYQEEMFQEWLEDGNVIQVEKGIYATQDAQYRNRIKGMDGLRKYVLKEFWSDSSYAKGGKVGDNITFRHWAGDIQKGSINEDLGDGNFDVSSGFGRVLVNREDIISVDKDPIERKKLFDLFENGGGVNATDYDFEDIGQFSVPRTEWNKYSQEDFRQMGRKIVKDQFAGDLTRAYDTLVHQRMYFVVSGKTGQVASRGFNSEEEAKKEMYSLFEKTGDFSYSTKKFSGGGLTDDRLLKELHKLQREVNSPRLSTFRDGDTSEKAITRQKERTKKLQRISELLLILRKADNRTYGGGGSTENEFENKTFWVSSNSTKGKFQVMRGDYMTQFIYSSKAEAEAKARLLNSKTNRN